MSQATNIDSKNLSNTEGKQSFLKNLSEESNGDSKRIWTQVKDFTQTHKREIFISLLIVGLVLLAFSTGLAIGAVLSGSIQEGTWLGFGSSKVYTETTRAGYLFIGGLISSIFGAGMAGLGAGGLMQMESKI